MDTTQNHMIFTGIKQIRFKKIAWIQSLHLHLIQKFVDKPSNVLPLQPKQTFPPIMKVMGLNPGYLLKKILLYRRRQYQNSEYRSLKTFTQFLFVCLIQFFAPIQCSALQIVLTRFSFIFKISIFLRLCFIGTPYSLNIIQVDRIWIESG